MRGDRQPPENRPIRSLDGRQLFRQYSAFNEDACLDFLKKIHGKFRKLYLFVDRARQHHRSAKVQGYLQKSRTTFRVRWFAVGCPEFNVIEECWRQMDNDLLASRYYLSFPNLTTTIAGYLHTRRFDLDIRKYLLTSRERTYGIQFGFLYLAVMATHP